MRWGEHWRISRDVYYPDKSLFFQLGSILPDWFERHPIHRWVDTKELFLDRICKISRMKRGKRREWYLGTIAHYICDYCCMAHNEEYYNLYRHRVYEVLSQKYDKKKRKDGDRRIEAWMNRVGTKLWMQDRGEVQAGNNLREKTGHAVELYTGRLHEEINALESSEWFRDPRVMKLDIEYSYGLLQTVMLILAEH